MPRHKKNSIKGGLINIFNGDRSYEEQEVLKDVSFEIKKGEFFGIVGRNGSGKSTLLKMLAGIYTPSSGTITINGSLTPFIELGVGFNPELTGRENVFLNGALLGFNRNEMAAMYDDIVEFAELERFMDQKLKNYSSGMQVRLAFSIAIRAQSDILLIDEVLAVGDAAFQQKCYKYFDELKDKNRTIILVTHDMGVVRQFCDRSMLIHDGVINSIGSPEKISHEYEALNYTAGINPANKESIQGGLDVAVVSASGRRTSAVRHTKPLHVLIEWDPYALPATIVGLLVYKGEEIVFANNTIGQGVDMAPGRLLVKLSASLGNGQYKLRAACFGQGRHDVIAIKESNTFTVYGAPFKGRHADEWEGIIYIENEWMSPKKP